MYGTQIRDPDYIVISSSLPLKRGTLSIDKVSYLRTRPQVDKVIIPFAKFICTNFLHAARLLRYLCYTNEHCTNLCDIISEAKLTL